jgi:hypothetical protein
VHHRSPQDAKVAFFGALFAARTDVYAVRFDSQCSQFPRRGRAQQRPQGREQSLVIAVRDLRPVRGVAPAGDADDDQVMACAHRR